MRRHVTPRFKMPKTRRARPRPGLMQAKRFVHSRSRGFCEADVEGVCTGRAEHVHHVVKRSQGGSDDPANLLDLCCACHTWAHANEVEARRRGLIKSREARAS